jgi:hypothetical protein
MKVKQIRITYEPDTRCGADKDYGIRHFKVEVIVNGKQLRKMEYLRESEFESIFEMILESAKRDIKNMIKAPDDQPISSNV